MIKAYTIEREIAVEIDKIVGMKLNQMNSLVATEAYMRGVKFQNISHNRFRMSYGGKNYTVRGGKIVSSPNSGLATKVVSRKEVLSRMLRSKRFNCPENIVFGVNDVDRAWQWAESILPIVLKPARGKQGKLVFVDISERREFIKHYQQIAKEYEDILVEKYVEGPEYRFTFIYNELVGIAKRVPANVKGDGESTIEQLIDQKNIKRRKIPKHNRIRKDEESKRVLSRQGYNLLSVPKNGEVIYLRNNSNVSTGGDAVDVTDQINSDIKEEITKAVKFINGLRICGADVIIKDNVPHIIEINTEPMLLMHVHPWKGKSRNLIKKVVDAMFPKSVITE